MDQQNPITALKHEQATILPQLEVQVHQVRPKRGAPQVLRITTVLIPQGTNNSMHHMHHERPVAMYEQLRVLQAKDY